MKKRNAWTVVLLLAVTAWAQQPASMPSATDSSSKSNSEPKALEPDKPLYQQDDAQQPAPETRPQPVWNSGVATSGVGGDTPFRHPVLTPSFNFVQSVQSQESTIGNGTVWHGQQTVAGALSFQWDIGQSGTLLYNGTGYWNSTGSATQDQGAQTVQQLGYSQKFHVGRWMFSLVDQVNYSPQSMFGFGGLQGLYGSSGLGGISAGSNIPSGVLPGTSPNQSILTTNAPRVSNTTAVEAQYSITARDAFRFGGNYGLIRGVDDNLLDGNQYSLTAGVDHRIDPSNTLGVTYVYAAYSLPNGQETGRTNSVGMSYSRRLTGRMSAQAYAGAQFIHLTQTGVPTDETSWGANATLTYTRTRNSATLNFYHGISGGSGVFAGANTTTIQGGFSHTFSPRVNAGVIAGYSRNEQLQQSSQNINNYFVGAQASRRLGRDFSLYFGYTLQRQTLSSSVAAPLAFNGIEHSFSVGINWSHLIRIAQ
jgi:hypothetical protein